MTCPTHSLYRAKSSRHPCSPWHHFARILQTKAEPGPSHSGFGRHNSAVSVARRHLSKRWNWPIRVGHTGRDRRRNPLRCNLSLHPLPVPTQARKADEAHDADTGPLSRELSCREYPHRGAISSHSKKVALADYFPED